jgi:hypothetical protein
MSDDFSNHPKTIGELQRERDQSCDAGKPRDILIEMLRDIDSGKANPTAMVICYREDIDGEQWTRFLSACPDALIAQGLLTRILYRMNEA